MAAGESMAQRMVWVDLEVSEVGGGCGQASEVSCEPVGGERRGSGSRMWQVSASREWAARGRSGGRSSAGVGVLGTLLDSGVSFQKGGVIHMAAP